MADGASQVPASPAHLLPCEVALEEPGIDLNTVFSGVAAIGSVAFAGAEWCAVTRPSDAPPDPPAPPSFKIELPPGVDEE